MLRKISMITLLRIVCQKGEVLPTCRYSDDSLVVLKSFSNVGRQRGRISAALVIHGSNSIGLHLGDIISQFQENSLRSPLHVNTDYKYKP